MDLVVVSVLVDAGAGTAWKFTEQSTSQSYGRSEGLALASLEMFRSGLFSSVTGTKECVDGWSAQNQTPVGFGLSC